MHTHLIVISFMLHQSDHVKQLPLYFEVKKTLDQMTKFYLTPWPADKKPLKA
jgi:hypothetical protein